MSRDPDRVKLIVRVEDAVRDGYDTAEAIAQRLGVHVESVRTQLRLLADSGDVERVGSSRHDGGRYSGRPLCRWRHTQSDLGDTQPHFPSRS